MINIANCNSKDHMKNILLAAGMAIIASNTHAQVSFGPVAGLYFTHTMETWNGKGFVGPIKLAGPTRKDKFNWKAGGMVNYQKACICNRRCFMQGMTSERLRYLLLRRP